MVASLRPVSALPQSPTARVQETSEPSIKAAAEHQGRVEAKGVRSGREPLVSRTEFPEPSVSCRSRSASKSRSFSAMGSAASPRRNSLLLSRILCISKVIWLWGVAQATEVASSDVRSTARPPDRQSATLRPGTRRRSLSLVTRVRS